MLLSIVNCRVTHPTSGRLPRFSFFGQCTTIRRAFLHMSEPALSLGLGTPRVTSLGTPPPPSFSISLPFDTTPSFLFTSPFHFYFHFLIRITLTCTHSFSFSHTYSFTLSFTLITSSSSSPLVISTSPPLQQWPRFSLTTSHSLENSTTQTLSSSSPPSQPSSPSLPISFLNSQRPQRKNRNQFPSLTSPLLLPPITQKRLMPLPPRRRRPQNPSRHLEACFRPSRALLPVKEHNGSSIMDSTLQDDTWRVLRRLDGRLMRTTTTVTRPALDSLPLLGLDHRLRTVTNTGTRNVSD